MNPIDVYKKLPRKNCGKCPAGTCMAFAVQFLRRMLPLSACTELDERSMEEIGAMLSDPGDWKERRLQELFRELTKINLSKIASGLGVEVENDTLKIRYMGRDVLISGAEFRDELDIMDRLLILMYIKQAGEGPLSGKWAAFRDLKDGMIRAESFHGTCEVPLAGMFGHDREGLVKKLIGMGAEKAEGFATGYSFVVYPLPRIPLLVLLWPSEEDFGSDCKILLDSAVTKFLDIEAVLYLGMALIRTLKG